MWSTAAKRLVVIVLPLCALGWGGTAAAAKVETEASVVAKLYKDFAWQAIGGPDRPLWRRPREPKQVHP